MRANFVIMRRTYRTLNDYEMQHNAEVGLFTRPSVLGKNRSTLAQFRSWLYLVRGEKLCLAKIPFYYYMKSQM